MSVHDEYMTRRQARDLARRLARLERKTRSTAAAHADLRHSAVDGGVLKIKDADGNTAYALGTDPVTGITAPQYLNGPVPAQPSPAHIDAGQRVVKVQHSGLDVNDDPAPADFARAEVHVSRDPGFSPDLSTYAVNLDAANGSVTHSLPAGEWYVGIVWVTLSGQRSPMSEPVQAVIEPPVDAQDIQDTLDAAQERLDEYRDEVAARRFQALEDGLSENADNLADARTRLSAAEQTLSPLPGRIESAEQDVATAQEEATKAAAAAVEANNRAMTRLANGNFENDLLYWDYENVSLTSTAHSGQQAAQVNGWLRPGSSFPVVPDQIWELSLYYQYDVTVEFQAIDGDTRTTLSTHHLDGDSSWSDSGALRVTIPADVHMLSFTITGTSTIVDDITLRDVTDVVRLEEAANANRQKAEQAVSELAVMRLAVDGEGGLKDRLQSAETVLETKADTSALDQLDQKLAGDLAAFEAHYTRIWRQDVPPPAGTSFEWAGAPHASESIKRVDGGEVARNYAPNPRMADTMADGEIRRLIISAGARLYQVERLGKTWASYPITTRSDAARIESTATTPGAYAFSITVMARESWAVGMQLDVAPFAQGGNSYLGPRQSLTLTAEPTRYVLTTTTAATGGTATVIVWPPGASGAEETTAALFTDLQIEPVANVGDAPSDYFDGDSPSDRANDLWYNQDGVPHEWVNGTNGEPGGWVELSDDRINQLQTDVVEAAETAYLDRLVVRDEIVTPETITNRLWADLGVFNRLQAREGWIGGTNLADGAVTAEKITATRELITKIMGAEWAYISERLVVDGDLIANHADVISAAIQSLSVTERADLFEAFITTLGAQEAVIDLLIGTEAWIGGTMLKDDTVTTQHIEFTETMVGAFAELLHLVVDRIDANALWADQTWQTAGHFGSEDADQKTEVDGTGVTLYRKIDGEFIPAAQFGGGDLHLSFFDDTGEATGAITRDGHVSGDIANFQNYNWQGRPLFGTALPEGNEPITDSLSQRFTYHNRRVLNGVTDGINQFEYGFLPLSFPAMAGMTYEIVVPGLRLWNISEAVILSELHYNTDNRPAVLSDPVLGREAVATTTNIGTQKIVAEFTRFFHCEQDCEVNLLLAVRAENGNPVPRWWHSANSEASTAELWVRPAGLTPPTTGGVRDVYVGHPDLGGGEKSYYTGWTPTWHQAYGGTQKYTGSSKRLLHGYDPANGQRYSTHFGGYRNSPGYSGAEDAGLTMNQALDGVFITDGTLTITGAPSTNTAGMVWIHWHGLTSAPDTFNSAAISLVTDVHVSAGQQSVIDLPRVVLDAIQAKTFEGFTLYHPTHDGPWVSIHSQQSTTIRTMQPMMRLRYVR